MSTVEIHNFSNGFLHLSVTDKGLKIYYRIADWKHGLFAQQMTASYPDEVWSHVRDVPFFNIHAANSKKSFDFLSFNPWYSSIPDSMLSAASAYPHAEFFVLQIFAAKPKLYNTSTGMPAFFSLCLHKALAENLSSLETAELLCRPRKNILRHFRLSAEKNVLGIFKRLTHPWKDNRDIKPIETLIQHRTARLFFNAVPLPIPLITTLCAKLPTIQRFPTLAEAALMACREGHSVFRLKRSFNTILLIYRETGQMLRELGRFNSRPSLTNIENNVSLMKIHDSVLEKFQDFTRAQVAVQPPPLPEGAQQPGAYNAEKNRVYEGIHLPAPRLPGNQSIIPLTTTIDIYREGNEMHNCVGSYVGKIRKGICYIYRVIAPQRCTLEVRYLKRGPKLGQLKAKMNAPASPEVREAVTTWFAEVRGKYSMPQVKI